MEIQHKKTSAVQIDSCAIGLELSDQLSFRVLNGVGCAHLTLSLISGGISSVFTHCFTFP